MNERPIRAKQARNQLGTPGGAKSFLRGVQVFYTISNTFFQMGRKKFEGVSPFLITRKGQSRGREGPTTLSPSAQFAHVRPFSYRGRLRNLLADFCTPGLYCVTKHGNETSNVHFKSWSSRYGSMRFSACGQGSHWVFFHPDLFLVDCVSRFNYEKSREICVFWSDKHISNFSVFNNIKITWHYSVYMRTSGEKVHIPDEAERVQSVSYPHIRPLSGLYTVVGWREIKGCTCLGPLFATVMCKVPCFERGPNSNCNV